MKRRTIIYSGIGIALICLVLVACIRMLPTEPLTVTASLAPRSAWVGDTIRLTLRLRALPGVMVEEPPAAAALVPFVVKQKEVATKQGILATVSTYTYTFTSYDPGDYVLAPITIRYRQQEGASSRSVATAPLTIHIRSAMHKIAIETKTQEEASIRFSGDLSGGPRAGVTHSPDAAGALAGRASTVSQYDIHDRRTVRDMLTTADYAWRVVGAIAGVLIAIATILTLLVRLVLKPPPPPEPAPARALRLLKELKRSAGKGAVTKEHYANLMQIVTDYVRAYCALPPEEMTAKELAAAVLQSVQLTPADKQAITTIAAHCDIIKYAPQHMHEADIMAYIETVRAIVERTTRSPDTVAST